MLVAFLCYPKIQRSVFLISSINGPVLQFPANVRTVFSLSPLSSFIDNSINNFGILASRNWNSIEKGGDEMDSIYFSSFAEPTLYRFQAQLRLYFKLSGSFILSDTMEQVEEARYRSARAAMVVRLSIFLIKFPWFDFWEGSFSFSFSFSWINSPENRCRVVPCTCIYIYTYIHIFTIERTILYTLPFFRSSI